MASRAPEIEDFSNLWLFHPISHRLARALSKTPVHPNMVSLAGVFCGVFAGINYYHYDQGNSVFWGFFFMLVWHVLDGTDGHLARITGKATAAGRAIDGLADHLVFFSVYVALGLVVVRETSPYFFGWVLLAGASHAMQAALLDRQRQTYLFWVYSGQVGEKPEEPPIPENKFLKGLHLYFHYTADFFYPTIGLKQLAHDLKIGKTKAKKVSAYYKENYAAYLHVWSLISPNMHTAMIFVFTFLGKPLYYFLFEIFAMNIMLFFLLQTKKQKDVVFRNWLQNGL